MGGIVASRHFDEIRSLPLFSATNDESFGALVRGAYVQNFPPHTELISEGEPADFLYIVASGCVELFSAWQGRETSMAFLCSNSTFILAATIKDRPYLMSARTLQKSRAIMIPSEDIRRVFSSDPDFARSIVSELAGCYRASVKDAKNVKLRTSLERLANFILRQHTQLGGPAQFDLKFEKRRIASFLGMTPENLSRAFSSLQGHGVEVKGETIFISNLEALRAFAHPDPLIDS